MLIEISFTLPPNSPARSINLEGYFDLFKAIKNGDSPTIIRPSYFSVTGILQLRNNVCKSSIVKPYLAEQLASVKSEKISTNWTKFSNLISINVI